MKAIINLLVNMLESKSDKAQTVKNKHKLGKYKTHTRYNAFVRGKKPDLNPVRLHNETKKKYHDRLAKGKQWISEMKLGGAVG